MDLEKTAELELSNPCKFGSVNIYFIKEQLEYYTPIVKQMILDKQTTEQNPDFIS